MEEKAMASKNNNSVSGWTGWVAFAATLMLLAGFFHIITGLVGLFNDDVYVFGAQNVWLVSYTTWGWAHILWGLLAIWAGASLTKGNFFGRLAAIVVAVSSAMVSLAFIPVYPIWSVLILAMDVCVLYAVIVHGGEMKEIK